MTIYTIGFAKRTAAEFFGLLRRAGIKRLVDIRLRNTSALAGFTIARDLPFFLKELRDAEYIHELRLAPTDELLDGSRDGSIDWKQYESEFNALLAQRQVETVVDRSLFAMPAVLLCSEPTPDQCHRRLVAEYISAKWRGVTIPICKDPPAIAPDLAPGVTTEQAVPDSASVLIGENRWMNRTGIAILISRRIPASGLRPTGGSPS